MKKVYALITGALLCSSMYIAEAQTVTTFAGKENTSSPWLNFNNTTTALADAYFYEPSGIAWDKNGVMYITERNKVRIVQNGKLYNRSGNLGDGSKSHGYLNGTGNAGEYHRPIGIVDNGNGEMLIVDGENHAIRKLGEFKTVGNGQILSTVAGDPPKGVQSGSGTPGYKDGNGSAARFDSPKGMCSDNRGSFYICDDLNFVIRKMTASGNVTTLAGKGGSEGTTNASNGASSRFGGPWGVAVYDANHIVVTDNWNSSIRKVNTSTGATSTLCGKFGENWYKDGSLAEARFKSPRGIAVVDGLIYVADESVIRVIDVDAGTVSTFAGSTSAAGNVDGVGENARFGRLAALAFDGNNTLYTSDIFYNVIRKITIDNLSPVADISATKRSLQVNEETTLTDISGGKPATQRAWTIKDVSGSASNVSLVSGDLNSSKEITVKFTATGFYTVTLNVTNEFGNDEVVKKDFINVSTTSSIGRLEELFDVIVYPNPASGIVNVSSENDLQNANATIYDLQGRSIRTYSELSGKNVALDIKGISSGTYMLVLDSQGHKGAKRLIVD